MKLPEDEQLRIALVDGYVDEFLRYVLKRNKRYPLSLTTVRHIALRFRLPVDDVRYCIERDPKQRLCVSRFVYGRPPTGATGWDQILSAAWSPIEHPNASLGQRLVIPMND